MHVKKRSAAGEKRASPAERNTKGARIAGDARIKLSRFYDLLIFFLAVNTSRTPFKNECVPR